MTGESGEKALFHESQRLCQWWIWLIVIVFAVFAWWMFLTQVIGGEPFGTNPASDTVVWIVAIFVGIGLPMFALLVNMTTIVTPGAVLIRYRPLHRRTIKVQEIGTCEARDYRPLREFGGWGIRWSSRQGMAYTVSGNRGVRIELKSGRKILIGSRRPEELAAAISGILPQ